MFCWLGVYSLDKAKQMWNFLFLMTVFQNDVQKLNNLSNFIVSNGNTYVESEDS